MVKTGKMLLRLGFLVAIVIGLGIMFNWFGSNLVHVHMLGGILALVGGWMVALGSRSPRGAGARWLAALILLGGAVLGFMMMTGNYPFPNARMVHWIGMLVAVALAEMGGRN